MRNLFDKNKAVETGAAAAIITSTQEPDILKVPSINQTKETGEEQEIEKLNHVILEKQIKTNQYILVNEETPKNVSKIKSKSSKSKYFDYDPNKAEKDLIENSASTRLGIAAYKALKTLNSEASLQLLKSVSEATFLRVGFETLLQMTIDWDKVFAAADNKNNKFEKVLREEIKAVLNQLKVNE